MRTYATTYASELASDELDCLISLLKQSRFTGKHLEIGTAAGGTLWQMMQTLHVDHQHPFIVIDPMTYFPDQARIVRENLVSHGLDPQNAEFRIATSQAAFLEAEKKAERFDFILIDANHKLRYITHDLRWSRLLNAGGLLAIHDYSLPHVAVKTAVDTFLKKYPHYVKVAHVRDLLILKKETCPRVQEISAFDLAKAHVLHLILQIKRTLKKVLQ